MENLELKDVKKKPSYILTAEDILNMEVKSVPMLFAPILQKVGVAAICGGSDSGKSYLCLNLGLALCSDDEEVLGLKINKTFGNVIMVCTEDTAEDTCVRLTSLLKNREMEKENFRFIFETEHIEKKLRSELSRQEADLIIIDTFGDLFIGNLNQSIDIRQFFKPFKKLAKDFKCLILFNHHIGKGKENNNAPNKSDVLGSQGIESSCRTVLMLKKTSDTNRILTVVKGNNIPDAIKNKGMILDFDPENGFKNTGGSVNYSPDIKTGDDNSILEFEKKVTDLYQEQKSYQKVAEKLREEGHKISKNKVGDIIKKYGPSVPNPGIKDDGQKIAA